MRIRSAGRPVRALRAAAAAAALLLLGTACASMPSSGKVQDVEREEGKSVADDQQVRVFGEPPQPDETPTSLVEGFLEAITSDESGYQTAFKYLTAEAAGRWDFRSGITIVEGTPTTRLPVVDGTASPNATTTQVIVGGDLVATVDAKNSYEPAADIAKGRPTPLEAPFDLVKDANGQWRINRLPNGLVLSHADFRRIYKPVSMYWFAASAADLMLVPDPIYLRSRDALTVTLVDRLLGGPTPWLAPAVETRFPAGTRLSGRSISVDDNGQATLQLSAEAGVAAGSQRCNEMAAQMLYTLRQVVKVDAVELTTHRAALCQVNQHMVDKYDPAHPVDPPIGYFLKGRTKRVANRLLSTGQDGQPLAGPFGDGSMSLSQLAVARRNRQIAALDQQERKLYVTELDTADAPKVWAEAAEGHTFHSLTWDGRGGLWVLDRDNTRPGEVKTTVLWVDRSARIPVTVEGLDDGRIEQLRVSPDGTRAVMVVRDKGEDGREDGASRVVVGRIDRGLDRATNNPVVTISAPRRVMTDLQQVNSLSWNGSSRLVVLAIEQSAQLQPKYVDVDGSNVRLIAALSGIGNIAAPNGTEQALLADSSDGWVYRLEPGANWTRVVDDATHPVYPG
ncbi:LpqB family beta-propeller domain-containing protein [Yinghuangia soli]|uniref:LpqB family beta-propeller domain-containing protein n=1 Tax=Yinghuangia soli TaxID=2908204 RepID=A0AA41QBV1_9ACTN|nr:LpqB family beta-propeller domain-containing protein [Yinghuangia soli]MCF2533922.1 LpqB family beta-propeller domain-containing protein [Yinghuangia soli]